MNVDEALEHADALDAMFAVPTTSGTLAAEVRRLRAERDAVLNMLEGYAPDLTRRLREQMAFEREVGA